MFRNIGRKIKSFASLFCWLGMIACVIVGGTMLTDRYSASVGIIIMIAGLLLSWVASLLLYGFGELVDTAMEISNKLDCHSARMLMSGSSDIWKCTQFGQEASNKTAQSEGCGEHRA